MFSVVLSYEYEPNNQPENLPDQASHWTGNGVGIFVFIFFSLLQRWVEIIEKRDVKIIQDKILNSFFDHWFLNCVMAQTYEFKLTTHFYVVQKLEFCRYSF